ncbi:MAG: phosphatidylinositol kinase [Candidatus Pristimantibacillus lignocellulolyticus]|uniref:Phosphatidylinositol kinase n=1 Tax=Candidatus Pristimantibacillus lignocellulolyticus TaxID=2994561 RepID=A0A9J6ZD50_9BACL|nr:MAG: phosphatidylinositol kinase [Candidatus Pristimantibacillus lignocellulolyticus]
MNSNDYQQICWNCMNKYVGIQTADGKAYDGFIAHVDQNYVTLAIPTDEIVDRLTGLPAHEAYRQFGFHPGFFPRRRFFQRRVPLSTIGGLFLLPFFF